MQAIQSQPEPVTPYSIKHQLVKHTFYFAYIFLVTTGTITFIEALRTKDPNIRHIMNLETCISIVAAYFYSQFTETIKEAEKKGEPIPYDKINVTRYVDWFISTPLMLFVLCIVLAYESKRKFTFFIFTIVLMCNIAMLSIGYLGEIRKISRQTACFLGFIAFAALYWYIWVTYMQGSKQTFGAVLSYYLFLVVWAFYGVVYLMEEEQKNIVYNLLDTIAKAFVGIFFWMYFTKVIVF